MNRGALPPRSLYGVKTQQTGGPPVVEDHTYFIGLVGTRSMSSFRLNLVGLLIDDLKHRLCNLVLPPVRHDQRKVLVQLLVCLRQLATTSAAAHHYIVTYSEIIPVVKLFSFTKYKRPVFGHLPEPNRAWLLVVYFSR